MICASTLQDHFHVPVVQDLCCSWMANNVKTLMNVLKLEIHATEENVSTLQVDTLAYVLEAS